MIMEDVPNVSGYMHDEAERLSSFESRWPKSEIISGDELARAGFFYLGESDCVQCAFCLGKLRNWDPGDIAIFEHKKYFASCPFVRGELWENLLYEWIAGKKAKFPAFVRCQSRIDSFDKWKGRKLFPEELSSAGFFLLEDCNEIVCFFCGGILKEQDCIYDPLVEHCSFYPSCLFIRAIKGREFVENTFKEKINEYMKTPLVSKLQDLGFKLELIYETVAEEIKQSGKNFDTRTCMIKSLCSTLCRNMSKDVDSAITKICSMNKINKSESIKKALSQVLQQNLECITITNIVEEILKMSSSHDIGSSTSENDAKYLCKICVEQEVCTIFLPCGHLLCCESCAALISDTCSVCRGSIEKRQKVFFV